MLISIWNPRWPPRELSMQYNHTLQGHAYSFSFHKLFLCTCKTYTHYDTISQTRLTWFCKNETKRKHVFQHNLKSKMATNRAGDIYEICKNWITFPISYIENWFRVYAYILRREQVPWIYKVSLEYWKKQNNEKHNFNTPKQFSQINEYAHFLQKSQSSLMHKKQIHISQNWGVNEYIEYKMATSYFCNTTRHCKGIHRFSFQKFISMIQFLHPLWWYLSHTTRFCRERETLFFRTTWNPR